VIDDGMLSIGDLSQRTGLPVRTIRFYSDAGVVSESARSPAGYRLYNREAVIRLGLVRTLRELDVPLGTIRAVLSERTSLAQVATAHVDTLEVQIRQLRLRRAVLRALAKTEATPQEAILMHHLVSMSEPERQRLIDDFLRETFGGLDANPELVALLDSTRPELPDDPEPAQVNAWVELTDLVQDPDFRASVRRMAQYQADQRAAGDDTGLHHDLTVLVIEQVQAAIDAGIDPASPAADAVVDHLIDAYAQTFTRSDTAAYRAEVLHRLEVAADPRAQQYFHLVTQINGWPPQPDLTPVFEWFTHALRTHPSPTPQMSP
jgi:DNA-binding transcriptional MerR regulator